MFVLYRNTRMIPSIMAGFHAEGRSEDAALPAGTGFFCLPKTACTGYHRHMNEKRPRA